MWRSPYRTRLPPLPIRINECSMACCSRPPQRPYAPSPLIPNTWVRKSAFSPCSILGALTYFIIPTCIVWSPAGDSLRTAPNGLAVQKLQGLKLTAVATRSEKSARAAAEAFGAEHWYDDAFALVRSEDVDIVSICVKVPEHRKVLLAALEAGKHVYCEWPLGRNLQEAEELAAAAERAGFHVAIGLQARLSPAARRARQLVAEGAIGRPLSARIVSTEADIAPQGCKWLIRR
jgi:hypothetical protein